MYKSKQFLILFGGLLLSVFASCKKDETTPVKEVEINLPSTLTLAYGEEKDLDIPAELASQTDVNFSLSFTENENMQIDASSKLYDKLAKAITVDRTAGKIHVNSGLIYPNGAVSATTNQQLPDNYKITVIASSANQTVTGQQTIAVTVTPGTFTIKGLDSTANIPYAYVLYSDTGATFDIETSALSLTGTSWYLDSKGADDVVAINNNKVEFKASAGDPDKQEEQAYDLVSTLRKDGFDVATKQFRVIFIPQIKFFYGTYYPEYNLTILTNQVYIALSNAYVSAAPTLYPEKYKSTFSVTGIEKDGVAFEDKDGVFVLNETTGSITVNKNTTLTEGSYRLTVKAVTTTGLEFSTTMTLIMSKLEE